MFIQEGKADIEIDRTDAYFSMQDQSKWTIQNVGFLRDRMIRHSHRLFKDNIDLEIAAFSHSDDGKWLNDLQVTY